MKVEWRTRTKPFPMPRPDQPVRVRVMYTGWNIRERWLTFPNFKTYIERCESRYRTFTGRVTYPRMRRRFTIMEVTWDGKKTA